MPLKQIGKRPILTILTILTRSMLMTTAGPRGRNERLLRLQRQENLLTGTAIRQDLDRVYAYFPRLKERNDATAGYTSCVRRAYRRLLFRLVAGGVERRRSDHHESAELHGAERDRGGVRVLPRSFRAAPLPDRGSGRAALGHLRAPLHRDSHAGIARHRCLVRGACH